MEKSFSKLLFIVSLLVAVTLLASCNFPTPTPTSTEPPPAEATEPEPAAETETPTPECAMMGDPAYLPTIGSKLTWIDNSIFYYIPEGEFIMGADSTEPHDYNPQHVVFLDDYWMQEAEVTNQQYASCVEAGICTPPNEEEDVPYRYGDPDYDAFPVVGVDWQQADDYCTWINARLPSEAEWEKGARGTDGFPYPWGVDEPTCDLLNYNDCLDPSDPTYVLSYEDGQSLYEVKDLAGNVFEWVHDWYQEDYYFVSPAANPFGPAEGLTRVYRGGSYKTAPDDILSWMRFNQEPEKHSEELGFRCVLDGPVIECDTLIDSSVTVNPPPCEVPAVNVNQPGAQPTFTPFPPCELATINAFCEWRRTSQISGINISVSNCFENLLYGIQGNGFDLNCTLISSDPPVYQCEPPPGSAQGSTVNISYCNQLPAIQINPTCPAGYEYNFDSRYCEPAGPWLPDPPCPEGYVEDSTFGCLPELSCGCPAGFYEFFGSCLPLDDCLWPGSPPCEEPVCAEGEVYDPENECCAVPEKLQAVCPSGFYFNTDFNICMIPNLFTQSCFTAPITLPYCPTPTPTFTPTPTSTPTLVPNRCNVFTTYDECVRNKCRPVLSQAGGFLRCEMP